MLFGLSTYLAELKRRKVYRVAATYAAVGLAVSLAVPDLFGAFGFPSWAAPLVIVVIAIGFPIALVLAWSYEVRPEEPTASAAAPAVAGGRRSIVVLPFDNMSPDPGDAYLAEGLCEEIITSLSHLRSLRVISRSSAMVLKGTQKDVRTIGRELDVQYVLEGSVRKAGDDLRITAQLIDARSDEHLWARRYNGMVGDVFGMQEQISRAIVDALEVQLLPEDERQLDRPRIDNLKAFEFYVQARSEIWSSLTEASLTRGLQLVERGLEVVGDNDLLLAAKGMVLFQYVNSLVRPPETYEGLLAEATQCAERALRVNPNSASGHALFGYVLINSGDPEGAIRHFREALRLNPNDPEALHYLGFLSAAGGWPRSGTRRLLDKLAKVDPLTPASRAAVVWLHWFDGEFRAATDAWREYLPALVADRSPMRVMLAYLSAAAGDLERAIHIVDQVLCDTPEHILTSLGVFLKHAWLGEKERALEAVTKDLQAGAWWDDAYPLLMADAYALIEDRENAIHWLEHAIETGMTNVPYLRERDPFLENLRSDQQFEKLMGRAVEISRSLSSLADVEAVL